MTNCPICRKKSQPEHKPFCSQRCAEIDLGRWFSEAYALPAKPPETGTDEDV